jgi:flagellar protein FlaJ
MSFQNIVKTYKRIGYLKFGKYTENWLEQDTALGIINITKLKKEIKQAGWELSLRGYLGISLFGSLLSSVISLIISALLVVMMVFSGMELALTVIMGIIFLLLTPVIFYIGIYIFSILPSMYINGRKTSIDASLPTVASYMSAMTSSGVPPAPIFESLAKEKSISKVVAEEATRINRDIEILGLDVLKALEQAAYRSPSERWANFLEGIIATVTSGGDLTTYLATETKSFMKLKQEETKEFIEQLGIIAEIFMVVGVVTPLFFVVMIAILSILNSDSTGSLILLLSITYVLIPVLMLTVIILLSTTKAPDD